MISPIWTSEKLDWLRENCATHTYAQMEEALSIKEDSIRKTIRELGLKRPRYVPGQHPRTKIVLNDEVMADLENPRLTSVVLAEKYGVSDSRIQQLRKQHVTWYKPMVNTLANMSSAEKKVKSILDDLDTAYLLEKRIGKYSIDFYLGRKCCIEVQGSYWHSEDNRKKRDTRKRKYLKKLGYKLLYVTEEELRMKSLVKLRIKQFIRVSLFREEDEN